ncbi:MAG: GTPase Era [Chitinophagaceae bacterium]|jgi:GTP-binding protein Era|nr:GTPase Era [Chitinophagaceae bacterium]
MKSGFVNIFGQPNAGKSTLLNALIGEKMAIVSPRVQTTRHRIKVFLNAPGNYQIVLSDTPGIIEPKYKLHETMMQAVQSALEDADLALLLVDITTDWQQTDDIFSRLRLKVPAIVVLNKIDAVGKEKIESAIQFFQAKKYCKQVISVSALQKKHLDILLAAILPYIPDGMPFYSEEDMSDLPMRFFVGEMIREKIYATCEEEIPYQTAVVVNEYTEKEQLVKIQADIIVSRESQKAIILGERGSRIKEIGTLARTDIEAFIGRKVFLELFVKVRPNWRDNERQLKEYGYR